MSGPELVMLGAQAYHILAGRPQLLCLRPGIVAHGCGRLAA
jgi:hypothetical protein